MGSTQIINQTSKPLDMKVGNYRHFTKLATVETNKSYTVHINCDDTCMEYSLAADDGAGGNPVIVNSDECVDNKTIIVREVNGNYELKMEPRSSTSSDTGNEQSSTKKSRWRFWEH
jgi:hypothetical protein